MKIEAIKINFNALREPVKFDVTRFESSEVADWFADDAISNLPHQWELYRGEINSEYSLVVLKNKYLLFISNNALSEKEHKVLIKAGPELRYPEIKIPENLPESEKEALRAAHRAEVKRVQEYNMTVWGLKNHYQYNKVDRAVRQYFESQVQ